MLVVFVVKTLGTHKDTLMAEEFGWISTLDDTWWRHRPCLMSERAAIKVLWFGLKFTHKHP